MFFFYFFKNIYSCVVVLEMAGLSCCGLPPVNSDAEPDGLIIPRNPVSTQKECAEEAFSVAQSLHTSALPL